MLVAGAGAGWLTVQVEKGKRQQRAAAEIKRWGGTTVYEYRYGRQAFGAGAAPGSWAKRARAVCGDGCFDRVVGAVIAQHRVTDDEMVLFRDLPALQHLELWHADITGAGLVNLRGAHRLQRLQINSVSLTDEGLGGLFFGIPPERVAAVKQTFGIPADHDPIGAITIGHRAEGEHPSGSPTTKARRDLAELVHRGAWGH